MRLYETALGDFDYRISSGVPEAQDYFGQGVQMMYAFAKEDAARSFREAWKQDPECAICYWGEAWSWGSYLNGRMRSGEAPHAYAAIQRAIELANAGHGDARERALIDALSVRYVDDFNPETQATQDSAYANAMADVYAAYPDDLDIGTLYAESLFLLEPRRGTRDLEDPDVQRLHGVLEGVLSKDIRHPGACHLYIHATESTLEPQRGEACAEYLGSSIPGASHINHMPSHTWSEVGRWGDAVRANTIAWQSDLKAEYGEGFAIYPSPNLHMLRTGPQGRRSSPRPRGQRHVGLRAGLRASPDGGARVCPRLSGTGPRHGGRFPPCDVPVPLSRSATGRGRRYPGRRTPPRRGRS